MENYKFIKDYTYKTGSSCPEGMLGCMPDTIIFKKDDILGGLNNNLSKDGKTVTSFRGNFSYIIPIEYLISIKDNQQVVNAPQKEVTYSSVNQSPEEKFYETLGIKQYDNSPLRGFPVKLKGRLLVAVVLVAGYFAYKKYKK